MIAKRSPKKVPKTAILLITPETGRLPEGMCDLARYISGKSGGLGEVVTALCEGLTERGINCHLATLNLKKRFQKEGNIDESEWREIRYQIDPERIHLVSSSIFADLPGAYSGNVMLTASEFQKQLINHVIKTVSAKNHGKLILHTHDWMAGGPVTAYAKSRGIPVLHTVHNVFTCNIPESMYLGVDLDQLDQNLYYSYEDGNRCIDCQATAIKSATLVNLVGHRFLEEIVEDYFQDRAIIPDSVRREIKAKKDFDSALTVLNCPSLNMYPESCSFLHRNFGADDDILEAKKDNLMEFQRRTGLNVDPNVILLYWPSRLDPCQKGIELLEDIALKFVIEHGDVQIAVVGDGIGGDKFHEEIMGRIACASQGKICYHRFNEELSLLGFAAANDVFGASLYEPCGQIDQLGNLFGATATNRDTGGYHDKIHEMKLRIDGAEKDSGNGFLFEDYDSGGLWYGLHKCVEFHRRPAEVRAPQLKRIMKEIRSCYKLDRMIDSYIKIYERLNGGVPLV
ncbi:MAG: Glycogen synthase [Syntrophus sp. PtaB.Bin001]|jgi:glycogen synthase|nr:MAG: Glycogen synthase [Syntrophus sp. PtaB.Bin001]